MDVFPFLSPVFSVKRVLAVFRFQPFFLVCDYRHEIEVHGKNFNIVTGERDEFGYFYCRVDCGKVFLTKTTRNRYM